MVISSSDPAPTPQDILEFLIRPMNSSVVQSTTVTLQCVVMSTLEATIEWWFTTAGIQQSTMVANQQGTSLPNYAVQSDESSLTLVIQNVQFLLNHGTYICRASSSSLIRIASASINVLCK